MRINIIPIIWNKQKAPQDKNIPTVLFLKKPIFLLKKKKSGVSPFCSYSLNKTVYKSLIIELGSAH